MKEPLFIKEPVFIVVSAFNEAAVIEKTLEDLLPLGHAIVLVDDASTDGTEEIVRRYPVHYLRHSINLGQGAALQTGIQYALQKGAAYLVTFDADGQHYPPDITPMLERLVQQRADIVFGSRFLSGARTKIPFARKCVLYAGRWVNFLFAGIWLSDAHNGLRVFNKKTALIFRIVENRMSHATEILIQTKKHGLRFAEHPTQVIYSAYSRRKGQKNFHGFKIIQDIFLYKLFK